MKLWQVDSFATQIFKGNPAAVCVYEQTLDDTTMLNIAIEMNLSETAFVQLKADRPLLRWFTPAKEVDLCGHATLAAAHIYLTEQELSLSEIVFDTVFVGPLRVEAQSNHHYTMDFPARAGERIGIDMIPSAVLAALSPVKPIEAYLARDLMLVYEKEDDVRTLTPDFEALKNYEKWVCVTAPSTDYDFVSRFFCVDDGILEDPVTGSAHCTLAPYWSERLKKTKLTAYQASKRGGILDLECAMDRVKISGAAITVFSGELFI